MNTRAECREAAAAGEPLFVSMDRGEQQILFRYLDGLVFIILLATPGNRSNDQPDTDAPIRFVDALNLPAEEGQTRPRVIMRDGLNDWYSIKNYAMGASLIEWASDEDIKKAEAAFKDALASEKDGEDWVRAVSLVAP